MQIMSGFPDNAVDFILTDPLIWLVSVTVPGAPLPATKPMDRFITAWKTTGFSIVGHLMFTKTYTLKAAYVDYCHECAYILAKGRPCLPQNLLPDVQGWKYSGNRHHPTEKPVTSLQPLLESFTHPGAIVLDPFAGSGSTCVAALQAGRRYIGIELLEQYHRAGKQRLAAVIRTMQQPATNGDSLPEAA